MMRPILFALLLPLGCGSVGVDELDAERENDSVLVEDDGEFTTITIRDSFDGSEDLGSLEEPLSVPVRYGSLNFSSASDDRCQGTPANDFCVIPRDKSLQFCNGLPFGGFGTPDYFGAADTAISESAGTVASRGWAISSSCVSPRDVFQQENGECNSSTALACAQMTTAGNDPGVVIRGLVHRKYLDSAGRFCRIFVNIPRLEARIAGVSEANKQAHRATLLRHEIGHCLGLGHNASTSGNDRLMADGVFPDPALHFSAAELAQLRDYIP